MCRQNASVKAFDLPKGDGLTMTFFHEAADV